MVGKKGFVRILEAGIAGMLLLGFLFFVTLPTYTKQTNLENEAYKSVDFVLDQIIRGDELRNYVWTGDLNGELEDFVKDSLNEKGLGSEIAICGINEVCVVPNNLPDKDIFVRERVVSSAEGVGSGTKKIAIYAWFLF